MGKYESLLTLILVLAIFMLMGGCSHKTNDTSLPDDELGTVNGIDQDTQDVLGAIINPQLPEGLTFDLIPIDNLVDTTVAPGSTHYFRYNPGPLGDGTIITWEASSGYFVDETGKKSQTIVTDVNDLAGWTAPDADGPADFEIRASGPGGSGEIHVSFPVNPHVNPGIARQPYYSPLIIDDGTGNQMEVAAGELLVKFNDGTGIRKADAVFEQENMYPISKIDIKGDIVYRMWINGDADLIETRDAISKRPDVEYCEFNYINHLTITPDDPSFAQKWDLVRMNAPTAWELEDGSSDVIVAVIDTGVDMDHPDLVNRVIDGMDFVPGGEGNGAEVYGDGIDNNYNGMTDENVGHGTHVAGIIGAEGNNGIGGVGVNLEVTIMPLKVFPIDGDGGASTTAICSAIEYARTHDADVINLSLGSPYYSASFRSAVVAAVNDGINVVCAAGNSGVQDEFYPAAYEEAIAVAAITSSDARSSFSNYGIWVDICAPGSSIHSTLFNNTYAYYSGTSMASPEVAGVVALMKAARPDLRGSEIRAALLAGADASVYDANPSYTGKLGAGCADAYGALVECIDDQGLIKAKEYGSEDAAKADDPNLHKEGFIPK